MSTPVVLEISGADSIAAALRYAGANPDVRTALPTYAMAPTEFGDFSGIEANLAFLADELEQRHGVTLLPMQHLGDPALWRALNGRFASVLASIFGAWTPCAGCHLYFHLLRIPVAREVGAKAVVSGERIRHGARLKPNQSGTALDSYSAVLANSGIRLVNPLRDMADAADVEAILGPRWPGGSPQMECALSSNFAGVDGCCALTELPDAFFADFLVPVGRDLAAAISSNSHRYEAIVARHLRPLVAGAAQ